MKTVSNLLRTGFILLLFPFVSGAQENMEMPEGIFLFNEFTDGRMQLNDKSIIETQFNYDCEKQELYYKQGNEYLQMYNTTNVDTLFVGTRKFVPTHQGASYFEYIPAGNETLMVDWKLKLIYKGTRGAMGVVTQSGGQASVDMELIRHQGISNPDNSVYKVDLKNTYHTYINGKEVSFNNLKSFIKLYPNTQQKTIRQLAKTESVNFDNPWQVAKLIVLCRSL